MLSRSNLNPKWDVLQVSVKSATFHPLHSFVQIIIFHIQAFRPQFLQHHLEDMFILDLWLKSKNDGFCVFGTLLDQP